MRQVLAIGHNSEACEAAVFKCCHCKEEHPAWNPKCKEYVYQSILSQIMHTKKLHRFDGSKFVRLRHPDWTSSYASVARANRLSIGRVLVRSLRAEDSDAESRTDGEYDDILRSLISENKTPLTVRTKKPTNVTYSL